MKQRQCHRCGFEKEMASHNFCFDAGGREYYLCDDCRLVEMIKKITDSFSLCPHLIDIEKLEKILAIIANRET